MPVTVNLGRRGALRKWLFRLRQSLPNGLRRRVWQANAAVVMAGHPAGQPQGLFRSIELETRTRCNSGCTFCAASIQNDRRPDIRMSDALYDKLLAELAAIGYTGTLKFFVNNEPLLDPRTAPWIAFAKARVPGIRTEVHTNGLKLNPRSGRELLEAGLDCLQINNYSNEGELHRGVKAFLDEVAPQFPDREIRCQLRLLDEQLLNRGGTAPNGQQLAAPLPLPCVLPFEEVVLTADGRVTICCQDHEFEAAVGNFSQQSLQEIWYGEGFTRLRAQLRAADRSGNAFCQACDFKGYRDEHLGPSRRFLNRLVGDLWSPGA
jgi:radical SAM protein with 4Fe4S-binding SPASM domain